MRPHKAQCFETLMSSKKKKTIESVAYYECATYE